MGNAGRASTVQGLVRKAVVQSAGLHIVGQRGVPSIGRTASRSNEDRCGNSKARRATRLVQRGYRAFEEPAAAGLDLEIRGRHRAPPHARIVRSALVTHGL